MSNYQAEHHAVSSPSDGVLLVQFQRPPVNAANEALWRELQRLMEQASADSDVQVIVLGSTNLQTFTAGLDLQEAASMFSSEVSDPSRRALQLRQHILDFQNAISSLERCMKPVVCAINGLAYGLALDIAFACDVRFVASDVRFAIKEVDIGLAADIGSLQRGPKASGNPSLFRELALTGRDFGAEEAQRLGAVSRVVQGGRDEVQQEALKVAKLIASKSPVAVVGTKYILNASRDLPVQEGLNLTAAWNAAMLQSEDITAAVQAVMSKSKPVFSKL